MVASRFALPPTLGLAGALLLMVGVGEAAAAPVSLSYTASGVFPGSPPASPLAISFQVDFDNSSDLPFQYSAIMVLSEFMYAPAVGFAYSAGTDQMVIGANNGAALVPNSNDFQIILAAVTTMPTLLSMTLATDTGYLAAATSLALTPFDAPEPASLGLLGAGLAGIGAALRRRQTRS